MTFREKIDKLLTANRLKINSVYGLEQFIGASPGSISKYYKVGGEPGKGTIKKILDGLPINRAWWETGKGEVFIEKLTTVPEPAIKQEDPELIRILIKNIDSVNEVNMYLLKRIRDLEG